MFNITELTCRVCLQEQQLLINVFDELEDLQTNLCSLLATCGDLQVEQGDAFPKYLCEDCTRELLIAAKFRDKCSKSNELLKNAEKAEAVIEDVQNDEEICTEEQSLALDNVPAEEYVMENQIDENLEDVISFVPNTGEDVLQEQMCADEFIETNAVDFEDSLVVTDDYTSTVSAEANGFEVHIELSKNAAIKSMPIKAKKLNIFKCDICGAAFVQAANLQKHLQKTHAPSQCYACEKCGHWFSIEMELLKHGKSCKGTNSDEEITKEDKKKRNMKMDSTSEPLANQRRCIYCEKEFQTPFALRMHLRSHTGERPFSCQYCQKAFKTQSSLNTHVKRHTGQADFICSVCGKSFYEYGNLDVHMRSHTGEKPHSCTICQKTFSRVFLLELHMRTHTGEKPFACIHCHRSFRQNSDLKNHLISTHTDIRKYSCTFCSKGYVKRSSLVQHLRTHSSLQMDANYEESTQASSDEPSEILVQRFEDIIESEDVLYSEEVS